MSDAPSPVRASAQELRHNEAVDLLMSLKGQPGGNAVAIIATALTAAEARGRQQAEQARDEGWQAGYSASEQTYAGTCKKLAAMTQALKDYGQHKEGCAAWAEAGPCTCGLDAALTGAQATV